MLNERKKKALKELKFEYRNICYAMKACNNFINFKTYKFY